VHVSADAGTDLPAEQSACAPRRGSPPFDALDTFSLGSDLAAFAQHQKELGGEALDSLAFEALDAAHQASSGAVDGNLMANRRVAPTLATPTPRRPAVSVSGWRDLNPRPSVPQTDALTKLRHSP
jgi:hypothetical protein